MEDLGLFNAVIFCNFFLASSSWALMLVASCNLVSTCVVVFDDGDVEGVCGDCDAIAVFVVLEVL